MVPASSGVTPEWFHAYQREWRFIDRYITKHQRTPSTELFCAKYRDVRIISANDIEYAMSQLREHHAKQGLIELLGETAEKISEPGSQPDVLMSDVHKGLKLLNDQVAGTANDVNVVEEWRDTFIHVQGRVARVKAGGMAGIPTGLPTLDLATGGPQAGDLWIVAARLGQGKTWALVRMTVEAMIAGKTVQYYALEQSKHQITMRIHAFLSRKYGANQFKARDLMHGQGFDLMQYKAFLKELPDLCKGRLIVNDTTRGRITPAAIASSVERNQPDVVIVDYLSLLAKQRGDWTEVASISADLQGLATAYEIPLIAASQINRSGTEKKAPPGAEHLTGSDAIGQDAAALVTMVQRSDHVMMMNLAKFRHGRDGQTWFAEFRPNSGIFDEVSGDRAREIMDDDLDAKDAD